MTAASSIRDLIGMVLAGYRNDPTGYRTLRPPTGYDEEFVPSAFATIGLLAEDVAEATHESPSDVLRRAHEVVGNSTLGNVVEMAILANDNSERFNELGEQHGTNPNFVPAIFTLVIWLAEEAGRATGTTCVAILEDLAITAAMGEAGMFPDDPEATEG